MQFPTGDRSVSNGSAGSVEPCPWLHNTHRADFTPDSTAFRTLIYFAAGANDSGFTCSQPENGPFVFALTESRVLQFSSALAVHSLGHLRWHDQLVGQSRGCDPGVGMARMT